MDNFKEVIEVLSFNFDPVAKLVKTYCQLDTSGSLIEYHITCDQVYYKWDDLLEDAWLQDWPQK